MQRWKRAEMEKKREQRGVRRGCARAEGPAPTAGPGQLCGSRAGSGPGNSWAAVALCRQRDRQGLPALPAGHGGQSPGHVAGVPGEQEAGEHRGASLRGCSEVVHGWDEAQGPSCLGNCCKSCPQSARGWC